MPRPVAARTEKSEETLKALLARSATDMTFRQKLLTNPRAAVAEFQGKPVDDVPDARITFIENQGDGTIVLPAFVGNAAELSEHDLEAVAGGTDPLSLVIVTVVATAIITYESGWF